MRDMPALRNLSALSFIDYVRLRDLVKHDGKLPTEVISQHDKDELTYEEAYNQIKELQHYADTWYEYNSNLSSAIVTLLYTKGLITKKEMENIPKIATELLKKDGEENETSKD